MLATFIATSFSYPLSPNTSAATIPAATASGYVLDGIAFYASAATQTGMLPVYRIFNKDVTDHLYTLSEDEKTTALQSKSNSLEPAKSNGIAFYAWPTTASSDTISKEGLVPVYRLYYASLGSRLYTTSTTERDNALNKLGYVLDPPGSTDGIAFYTYPPSLDSETVTAKNLVPVYQLHNAADGDYLYTTSEKEKNSLIAPAKAPKAGPNLGPDISVGLWSNSIKDKPFKIDANKNYNIKDKDGNVLAQVTGSTTTYIGTYSSGSGKKKKEYFEIWNSNLPQMQLGLQEIYFDSTDGSNSDLIFDVYRPNSSYDHYRGQMKIKYYNNNTIWMINILPLEQYVWGDGEISGTGPTDHTRVMTTVFRTYGYWYLENATKYIPYGFRIMSDSGSQIYYGYDWEKNHGSIKSAAQDTRGTIVTYKKDVALTPYSSWTDGRTRSFQERWGSKDYPWCQSVPDPYGKNPTMTTAQLEAAGNHMVGLSAHGSLTLAGKGYKWSWKKILKYYFTKIDLTGQY